MNFSVEREAILEPLQWMSGIVEKRHTLPILANVLIRVQNQRLSLVATDLEVELSSHIALITPDNISLEMTVPARKLMDICRSLPAQAEVKFIVKDQSVTIKSGRGQFTLSTLPATDFPHFNMGVATRHFSIMQKEIKYLFERTHFSMALDDVRYFLNGMLLEINKESIRFVTTDGHRLSFCSMPNTVNAEPLQIILPRKTVMEMLRLLTQEKEELLSISIGNDYIQLSTDAYTFTSKLIDGKFPDYEKVIPKKANQSILIDRDHFKQALTRVSILSNEKFRGVCLRLTPGKLYILANNFEKEEAEEEIDIQYEGEEFEIGFNVTYILNFLGIAKSPKIKMTFAGANSSMLMEENFSEPSFCHALYVVMPMRI